MSWKTYRPGRTSRAQDKPMERPKGPLDADTWVAIITAVFLVGFLGFIVWLITWTALDDIRTAREWEQWCADQHGEVVDHTRIPPEQVRDNAWKYCVVDGKVVGAR